jgi:phosphoglycerol transferase
MPKRPFGLALEGLLVAVASVLCAGWALHLWHADLAIPLRYTPVDDTKFYLMLVKGIADHGGYLSNPSLGAPFGQKLFEYPQGGDDLSLLLVRALALFTSDPALIVNLFFLSTFALVGFSSHLVLRSLGVGAPAAAVASILYSLLTYHFFRGESHLLLSAYYAVPLTAYLFLKLLDGAPLLARRERGGSRSTAWLSRRTLATVAICVVIGSDNLYYATFAAVMLLAAGLIMLAVRRWRTAVVGLALVLLVALSIGANLSPTLVYRARHGGDAVLERSAAFTESSDEGFSLRLANLLLPQPDNPIAPLRELAAKYDRVIAPGYCEACYASPGTVGSVGLLWLLLCALGVLVGAGGWFAARRLLRHASVGVIVALAVATVGGIASLIEVFVTADIRAWNRISVFIAFLSLLAVALLLERLLEWIFARRASSRARYAIAGLMLLGVLAFGVYDQTGASFVPPYAATARQWRSDARFVAEIERRLPRGAAVLELPYVPFPEGYPETPVGETVATYSTKYELLRGYLHSSTLRWSYGAMKGTPADWSAQLAGEPLAYVAAAAAASGFDGLWVDPAGFDPGKAERVRAALEALLGAAPLESPRRDLWFFALGPYLERLRDSAEGARLQLLREVSLHPFTVACNSDGLLLLNPYDATRTVTLTMHLLRAGDSYSATFAGVADRQASDFPAVATLTVSRRLALAPGRTRVVPGSDGLPPGAGSRLLYATLTEAALAGFAQAGDATARSLVPGLTGPPCAGGGG